MTAVDPAANNDWFEEDWQTDLYHFAQKYYRLINGHGLSARQLLRLRKKLDYLKNQKVMSRQRVAELEEWLKSEYHD